MSAHHHAGSELFAPFTLLMLLICFVLRNLFQHTVRPMCRRIRIELVWPSVEVGVDVGVVFVDSRPEAIVP